MMRMPWGWVLSQAVGSMFRNSCQEFRSSIPGPVTCHSLYTRSTGCCLYLDSNSSAVSEQVGPWAFWHGTWQGERWRWLSGSHCFPWADTFDSHVQRQIRELKLKDMMIMTFHTMNTNSYSRCLPSIVENEHVWLLSQSPFLLAVIMWPHSRQGDTREHRLGGFWERFFPLILKKDRGRKRGSWGKLILATLVTPLSVFGHAGVKVWCLDLWQPFCNHKGRARKSDTEPEPWKPFQSRLIK